MPYDWSEVYETVPGGGFGDLCWLAMWVGVVLLMGFGIAVIVEQCKVAYRRKKKGGRNG